MSDVDVLRRFNRAYTQRIGVLDESYLDSGRALGPSRLLYEVGRSGARLLDLRARLGLDSGYLSRMLRQLELDGLVAVAPDPHDGRQRRVRLTPKGRREWQRLERRSEELARQLVAPLTPGQRAALDGALTTADRLLRAATVTFEQVDPQGPDARHAMEQYFAELDERFTGGFDAAGAFDADATTLGAADGAFVLVRSDGDVVGCGGVVRIDDRTGEIKRMWIHPAWRGLGLGPRLLAHLESVASALGRSRVILDTNGTLTEARAMYERAGYHAIERYNDNPYAQHWFAKRLGRPTNRGTSVRSGTSKPA